MSEKESRSIGVYPKLNELNERETHPERKGWGII